ncbi:MAG TPA: cupin domain-containing protein [Gemmata sp.]|nr:cupin domain-containing protein [Gemmata sp.]
MDVSIGHLRLQPNTGHSSSHDHPGTELLMLLDGSEIELRLDTSEARIRIRKGEFVHFRSDMPHSAWNFRGEPASIFVIRFYQLRSNSARERVVHIAEAAIENLKEYQKQVNALKEAVTGTARKGKKGASSVPAASLAQLSRRLKELEKRIAGLPGKHKLGNRQPDVDLLNILHCLMKRVGSNHIEQLKENPPQDVADRFGLALLLDRLKGKRKLTQMASPDGFGTSDLSNIHNAQKALNVQDLAMLAKQYSIEPLILYSFMFPTEPNIVIGRRDVMTLVPESIVRVGARYLCPRYSLALSDVNIVLVELASGQSTPENSHPGYELTIPLEESEFQIEIDGEIPQKILGPHQYAYYSSQKKHLLKNIGTADARAFVVRMLL